MSQRHMPTHNATYQTYQPTSRHVPTTYVQPIKPTKPTYYFRYILMTNANLTYEPTAPPQNLRARYNLPILPATLPPSHATRLFAHAWHRPPLLPMPRQTSTTKTCTTPALPPPSIAHCPSPVSATMPPPSAHFDRRHARRHCGALVAVAAVLLPLLLVSPLCRPPSLACAPPPARTIPRHRPSVLHRSEPCCPLYATAAATALYGEYGAIAATSLLFTAPLPPPILPPPPRRPFRPRRVLVGTAVTLFHAATMPIPRRPRVPIHANAPPADIHANAAAILHPIELVRVTTSLLSAAVPTCPPELLPASPTLATSRPGNTLFEAPLPPAARHRNDPHFPMYLPSPFSAHISH
ncbi:hypothetical protein DFH07DRAFT_940382 [Mycena maculata]|uniref:Uncharacterized protein n=1 Tax=Mycena maculata TaxID=230809 RepID=A0AAD7J879_9AGAR|nr:hypothetical protein DFH07DRAFT_940382 [Mycena maculata]